MRLHAIDRQLAGISKAPSTSPTGSAGFVRAAKSRQTCSFVQCPILTGGPRISFWCGVLLALAETDATILCLLPVGAPCRDELDAKLEAGGRAGQVTFIDPAAALNPLEARLRSEVARLRGRRPLTKRYRFSNPIN